MARSFNLQYMLGDAKTAVAAAGSTQATAATCAAEHIEVTTATDGQGVVLVEADAVTIKSVINTTAVSVRVYPWSGAAFNGKTANQHLLVPPGAMALFLCHSPTKIGTICGLGS